MKHRHNRRPIMFCRKRRGQATPVKDEANHDHNKLQALKAVLFVCCFQRCRIVRQPKSRVISSYFRLFDIFLHLIERQTEPKQPQPPKEGFRGLFLVKMEKKGKRGRFCVPPVCSNFRFSQRPSPIQEGK